MKLPTTKRRLGMALVTGATAVGLVAGSGPASAQYTVGTGPKTVKIKLKGKRPFFKFPKRISAGEKLTIVNKTSPKKIGPHTFTLIEQSLLPKGKKQRKQCGKFKLPVCLAVVKAHKADPETGEVGKPNVDVGKKGWDKSFGEKGDSWVAEARGEKTSRKVSAKAGTTLYFFCAVHPGMQGKIKVVE